jgi:hypothetical protein
MKRISFYYFEVAAFILFLSIGYWVGSSFNNPHPVQEGIGHLKPTPSPIPALPDGERILLLAGVDKLESTQPQLESLWLLTYYLDGRPIQLLPIYPFKNNSQQPSEAQILDTFSVVKGQESAQLNPEFLRLLAESGFWLSGYLLMDDHATASVINLLGGLPTDSGLCTGEQILKTIHPATEQPQNAHDQQAILLGQACLTLSRMPTQPQWQTILELIPEHIITDLQPLRLLNEIQILASDLTQLRCEFPSVPVTP